MSANAEATRRLCVLLASLMSMPCVAQVYRCIDTKGATVYQAIPCHASSGSGAPVRLHVAPADPEAVARGTKTSERRAAQAASTPAPMPTQSPSVTPYMPPQKTELEVLADRCLDWYRPLLKDPRGAYHRDVSYKDYVLTFTIYATNSYGGYVSKSAACEIKNGKFDEAWTKTHAKRHDWGEK